MTLFSIFAVKMNVYSKKTKHHLLVILNVVDLKKAALESLPKQPYQFTNVSSFSQEFSQPFFQFILPLQFIWETIIVSPSMSTCRIEMHGSRNLMLT